jgi:hypothetical protein
VNQVEEVTRSTHGTDDWGDSMIRWSLDRLASMQSFAEVKVVAILGAGAILLAPVVDKLPCLAKAAQVWPPELKGGCIAIALTLYVCAGAGVAVSGLLVLWPRLRSSRRSLLYFGDIGSMTYEEFRDAYVGSSRTELRQQAISQIHDNARIARAKFICVRWCIVWLAVSLVSWTVLMAVA